MADVDLPALALAAAVLALVAWYFWHVARRMLDGVRVLKTLPEALDTAFDGSVPPWLRLLRLVMIIVICFAAAALLVHRFG